MHEVFGMYRSGIMPIQSVLKTFAHIGSLSISIALVVVTLMFFTQDQVPITVEARPRRMCFLSGCALHLTKSTLLPALAIEFHCGNVVCSIAQFQEIYMYMIVHTFCADVLN